jgi:hypothetical protein
MYLWIYSGQLTELISWVPFCHFFIHYLCVIFPIATFLYI